MKFSEQWLRSLVNPPVSSEELVADLSMAGLEVDGVAPVPGAFTGVVVGEVLRVEQHPDADRLHVCQVSNGKDSMQVVCGAPNVRAGLKVPFAMIGARLPGDFKIKKAKLRGVESNGMLCSAVELQLGEDNSGLLELPADAPVGSNLRDYLQLDDSCIEIDLTPNRGDCLSLRGRAREVGARYGGPYTPLRVEPVVPVHADTRPVALLTPQACPRYVGRIIRNVDITRPTPQWMVERLRRSDIRSINAVVDVTNYVMLELGQPMHAFDLAEIDGGIEVRKARASEKLVLLDGQQVTLSEKTLLIADHSKPLAIAGVMGGEHSGINDNTRDLLLESAYFNPVALAGTARSYGLHTDASHRYERGVDYRLQQLALERASQLLLDIVGGEPGPAFGELSERDLPKPATINLHQTQVTRMLGVEIPAAEIECMLAGLGLQLIAQGPGQWQVSTPSYRFDLSLEVDLIEEVARLYGYNRLPVRYPQARLAPQPHSEALVQRTTYRQLLIDRGYQEAITYSFIEPKLFELFSPDSKPLALANPISADLSVMRNSLWPGLVKAVQYNLNRHQSRVRLFEIGLKFVGQLDDLQQIQCLAGVITGSRWPESWNQPKEQLDFYDLKGDVEGILQLSGQAADYQFELADHPVLHPGQSARVLRSGRSVGLFGALHPQLAQALGLEQTCWVFELQLDDIYQGSIPVFHELSRFPEVRRDIALLVDRDQPVGELLEDIRQQAGKALIDLKLFDVYQGKGIDPTRKSVAVGLTWQDPSRTLTDDEVNACLQQVLEYLQSRFDASLRKKPMGALTKAEMAERLYEELGRNKREAKELVELFFEEIRLALEQNEQVKLSGFGNFNLRDKRQRPGRNPKTGEEIPITARRVVTFRPGQKLKARVEAYVGTKPE